MLLVFTYILYLNFSIALTVWVGRTLNKNGRLFLVENFGGNTELADSVNHLLLVGFYLINFGFISLALKFGEKPTDWPSVIEFLSTKVGLAILVLGVMHFWNMHALVKYRKSGLFGLVARPEASAEAPAKA